MNTQMVRGKRGGATIFLCIILSAVILTESVLFCAAKQRGTEAELQKCLRLQSAQILCNYNKSLLENYGLYAIDSGAMNSTVFDTCFDESSDTDVLLEPIAELTSENAMKGITDFMKLRFPAVAANELLSRLQGVLSQIGGSEIVQGSANKDSSAWLEYLKDYLFGKDTWCSILSNVASFVGVIDFTGKLNDLEAFASKYRNITEQKSTQYLQGEADTAFKDNILNPDTLSDMMSYADNLMNCDLPDFVDDLLLNEYAVSFFDSEIDIVKDGDTESPEKNILGTPYSEIHTGNHADLEYLLTGMDDETLSAGAAKVLVFNIRTLLNFGSFVFDKGKVEEAQGIAEVVSIVVAIISMGSVIVDPTVMKFIVLFVMAIAQSVSDLYSLLNGESVALFGLSSITDQPIFDELLMTDFRDYLGFFLLFVPLDWKMSRILTIFKRDCGEDLFTGVRISVDYGGHGFCMEDSYDVYSC